MVLGPHWPPQPGPYHATPPSSTGPRTWLVTYPGLGFPRGSCPPVCRVKSTVPGVGFPDGISLGTWASNSSGRCWGPSNRVRPGILPDLRPPLLPIRKICLCHYESISFLGKTPTCCSVPVSLWTPAGVTSLEPEPDWVPRLDHRGTEAAGKDVPANVPALDL